MKDAEINTLKAEKDKITKESELKERVHQEELKKSQDKALDEANKRIEAEVKMRQEIEEKLKAQTIALNSV